MTEEAIRGTILILPQYQVYTIPGPRFYYPSTTFYYLSYHFYYQIWYFYYNTKTKSVCGISVPTFLVFSWYFIGILRTIFLKFG